MRAAIVIAFSVLAVLGAVFAVHHHIDRTAQPYRDVSRMMSVRLITGEALSAQYRQRGSFPRSLSELPLQSMRWGDEGSSARELDDWHYASYGQSFTMTWTNARGADLFLGGKTGQVFYSRSEMR